ncbi:hypothetical protein VTL71DRAFT_15005 [Oculimacula yallundae]|uniref:Uncharacterized protein n=1 Tax=Oculimacula yallundae TaxID=86028 RepID=A0ABR4CG37_9HELO
MTYIRYTII